MLKKVLGLLSALLLCIGIFPQTDKLNQKIGNLQNRRGDHISFKSFRKYNPKSNEPAIGRSKRVLIHENKVYVLDERLNRLYVFDEDAHYIFTIGRPGQGPGDLEYPRDFSISPNGEIYILNSRGKQIEVFNQDGQFIERKTLKIPSEFTYSLPTNIILYNDMIFIGYHLSPSCLDVYSKAGDFQKSLFKRPDLISIPGKNIANSSHIQFADSEKSFLHFNFFSGIFSKISLSKGTVLQFSAHVDKIEKYISRVYADIQKSKNKQHSRVDSVFFHHWSDFCIDKQGRIYVFSFLARQENGPELFVFSPEGDFLYWTIVTFFKGKRIKQFACSDKTFVFITEEEELYLAKKGG